MGSPAVRFACPNCKKRLKAVGAVEPGKTTSCPFCATRITVPMPATASSHGASTKSTIMTAYQGRESDHLPSLPAKNPLLYALGGALMAALIGGGMYAAYTAGQNKAGPVAVGPQAPPAGQPAPQQPVAAPSNQPTSPPQQNVAAPSTNGSVQPRTAPTNTGQEQAQSSRETPETAPIGKPKFDDSNRPKEKPLDIKQPKAAPPSPVFVEVPVFLPPLFDPSAIRGKPDLIVMITPEDTLSTIPQVDHVSPPGMTAKLSITLNKTPKTEVKVTLTPPDALSVTPTQLTFSPNIAPISQPVTLTGTNNPAMTGPAKLVYLEISALGGGLTPGAPAKVPVQVLKRNDFALSDGSSIQRDDITTSSSPDLSKWKASWSTTTFGTAVYEPKYVQLTWSSKRYRIHGTYIETEISPDNWKVVNGIDTNTSAPATGGTWR